jgi:hypothetical protein
VKSGKEFGLSCIYQYANFSTIDSMLDSCVENFFVQPQSLRVLYHERKNRLFPERISIVLMSPRISNDFIIEIPRN